MSAQSTAAGLDRSARESTLLNRSVRIGLVGYAAVHLLIAVVAVRLGLGFGGSGSTTGQGALTELAMGGWGRASLVAMAAGFVALVVWQLVAGVVGYRELEGWWRHTMRFTALCRVLVYGYLAFSAGHLALTGPAAPGSESLTARVMAAPAGRLVVAGAGLTTAGIGIGLAVFGARSGFLGQLSEGARRADRRVPIVVVGQVGYVAKGLAFAVVGGLLCWAALWQEPGLSGGLDRSLTLLLGDTLGPPAVVLAGLGIGCFGLYLLARSRHLDRASITS